jgi:hypothetical protein
LLCAARSGFVEAGFDRQIAALIKELLLAKFK